MKWGAATPQGDTGASPHERAEAQRDEFGWFWIWRSVMRVGVNLVYLRPDRVGGGEVYCRKLLEGMGRFDGVELVVFCGAYAGDSLRGMGVEIVEVSGRSFSQIGRLYDENVSIARTEAIESVDVLFSPANIAAPFLPKSVPQVVTIHDLIHEAYPSRLDVVKLWGRRLFTGASVLRASRMIAVSEFTADAVREVYGFAASGITTVHEGVDREEIPSVDEAKQIVRELGIRGDFFVYPASDGWHKNHELLVEVFEGHVGGEDSMPTLVLCGRRSTADDGERAVEDGADRIKSCSNIVHVGYRERRVVLALLRRAEALLFPSLFEGFGLPLVEAMACETPIIASDRAAIPEVVGDAGLLVEPDDVAGWVNAMERVVGDTELREELVGRGQERVEYFSWERAARETLEVLGEAAGEG